MNRTERIDEMLNLMNVDVGTIEDKPDWFERMTLLCKTAIVLAYASEKQVQCVKQIIEGIEDYIGAKEAASKYNRLTQEGGEEHAEENS